MPDLLSPLRSYLLTNHAPHLDARGLERARLLGDGILQSIDVVDLVLFLEKTYGIAVPSAEVIQENFDSLDAIRRLIEVEQRRAAGT